MSTCPNCGHEFKPLPRIKVRKGGSFFVALGHGMATDTYTIGPVDAYKGKTAKRAVALAEASGDQYASVNTRREHDAAFVNNYIGQCLAKADLIPVAKTYTGYWTDLSADGCTTRVNSEYHAAMAARADTVMIDRNPFAPVWYLKDDTAIGLVMPILRGDRHYDSDGNDA